MRVAVDASTIVHARGQECRVLEEHGDDVGQLEGRVGRRASAGARELASHGQARNPAGPPVLRLGLEEGRLGGVERRSEHVAAALGFNVGNLVRAKKKSSMRRPLQRLPINSTGVHTRGHLEKIRASLD